MCDELDSISETMSLMADRDVVVDFSNKGSVAPNKDFKLVIGRNAAPEDNIAVIEDAAHAMGAKYKDKGKEMLGKEMHRLD